MFLVNHARLLQQYKHEPQPQPGYNCAHTIHGTRTEAAVSAPHSALEPITKRDMRLDRTHVGKALICRTVALPLPWSSVQLVVEDSDGDLIRLSLYNCSTVRDAARLDKLLPEGSVLLIKHPYYMIAVDGMPMVRCDNPANVMVLQCDDRCLQISGMLWLA